VEAVAFTSSEFAALGMIENKRYQNAHPVKKGKRDYG
jgi:hypothetical protein